MSRVHGKPTERVETITKEPETLAELRAMSAPPESQKGNGHRPPTGALTTDEQSDADERQQEALAKDDERIDRQQEESGEVDRLDREV